jgi:ecotin
MPASPPCKPLILGCRVGFSPAFRWNRRLFPQADRGVRAANNMRTILSAVFLTIASISPAAAADDMKAFPPAADGMTRHVIRLPQEKDESALKIELILGKTVTTDAINRYFFGGMVETENIPGWGFDRYILRKLGSMGGTLMAVDPKAPQVQRFIGIGGETILRYNSRLPVVVYVPVGVEVRYRLWRAGKTLRSEPEERR